MSPNSSAGLYMPQTYSFLSPEKFETLVEGYINQLHIRKRNKALITQQLANDCLMVLTNPENTAIFNPKFRWWVRKHFVFTVVGELRILLDKKNGKPVCVREQLYDKVCYFHHIIGHGGRDKTFAAITKSYSKVPAELVSLFTKNCQTCLGVRKYSKNKRPILNENEYPQHHPHQHHQCQQQQQQQLQQQLTCDTTGVYSSSSTTTSANTQYHPQQHQHYHGMINQPEQGTITPISPLLDPSSSGFFGQSSSQYSHHQYPHQQQHLASGYNHSTQQLIQQHQTQRMHNAAMQTHHMGMSMNISLADMSLGNTHAGGAMDSMPGLGHIGANGHHQLHANMSAMSSSCSTPTTLVKMDLPVVHPYDSSSMASALLSMGQQSQYQHVSNSSHQTDAGPLVSPAELNDQSHHHTQAMNSQYDHDQLGALVVSANSASGDATSVSQYSPLMDQGFQTTQPQVQQQQYAYQQYQQFHNNDYSAQAYATNDPQQQHQLQSTFSAALSLSSMPLIQPQQQPQSHHSYDQHSQFQQYQQQHDYIGQQQLQELSPVLTQNQMFQKQIQQEQQRFHQQQQQLMASVSSSSSSTSTDNATAAITMAALPPPLNLGTLSSSSLSASASSLSIAAIIASSPTLASAAPSLSCSMETPTPMSAMSTPPQSASVSSSSSNSNNSTAAAAAAAMVSSLLEHEPKNPLTAASSLISDAQGV